MRQVPVWDLATRCFHWLLVAAVLVCLLTGEERGLAFLAHAYAGYLVLVLVVYRVLWGVVGSPHSRFSDFVYSSSSVMRYGATLLRFKPDRYVGHNPLGGWMIVLMLVVLLATSITGLTSLVADTRALNDFHESLGSFMQVLVFVHLAGVLADRLLTGEKLVKAMITGRKELPPETADAEGRKELVGTGRALVLAVAVAAGGIYLFEHYELSADIAAAAERSHGR